MAIDNLFILRPSRSILRNSKGGLRVTCEKIAKNSFKKSRRAERIKLRKLYPVFPVSNLLCEIKLKIICFSTFRQYFSLFSPKTLKHMSTKFLCSTVPALSSFFIFSPILANFREKFQKPRNTCLIILGALPNSKI